MRYRVLTILGISLLCTACSTKTQDKDTGYYEDLTKAVQETQSTNCIAFTGDIITTSSDEYATYSATCYIDDTMYTLKQGSDGVSVTDYFDGTNYYSYSSDTTYQMPVECFDTSLKTFYLSDILEQVSWSAVDTTTYEATVSGTQIERIVEGYLEAQYLGIEASTKDEVLQDYAKKARTYLESDTYPSGTLTITIEDGKLGVAMLQYKSMGIQRIYSVEYKYDLESYETLTNVTQPDATDLTDYLDSIYSWASIVHECDTYSDALTKIN